MGIAPLAVTDDRQAGARIEQHQRRSASRVRALFGMVNVLATNGEAGHRASRPLNQDCRDTQGDIHIWIAGSGVRYGPDLVEVGRQAVHLPIAGDQLLQHHSLLLCAARLAARLDARQPGP